MRGILPHAGPSPLVPNGHFSFVAIHRFRGKPDALERRWTWFAEHWLRRSRLHLRMPLALEEYSGSQLSLPRLAAALTLRRPTLECALVLPVEEPAPPAQGGRSA